MILNSDKRLSLFVRRCIDTIDYIDNIRCVYNMPEDNLCRFTILLSGSRIGEGWFHDSVTFRRDREIGRVMVSTDDDLWHVLDLEHNYGLDWKIINQFSRSEVSVKRTKNGFQVYVEDDQLKLDVEGKITGNAVIANGGCFSYRNNISIMLEMDEIPLDVRFLTSDVYLADPYNPEIFCLIGKLVDNETKINVFVLVNHKIAIKDYGCRLSDSPYRIKLDDLSPGDCVVEVHVDVLNKGTALSINQSHIIHVHPINEFLKSCIPDCIHRMVNVFLCNEKLINNLRAEGLSDGCLNYPITYDDEYLDELDIEFQKIARFIADLRLDVGQSRHCIDSDRQYIRGYNDICDDKKANCVEMSCLVAACLIHCGLNPVIAFIGMSEPDHALVGIITDGVRNIRHRGNKNEIQTAVTMSDGSTTNVGIVLYESTSLSDSLFNYAKSRANEQWTKFPFKMINPVGLNLENEPRYVETPGWQ